MMWDNVFQHDINIQAHDVIIPYKRKLTLQEINANFGISR